ncbi:MAG: hypothetical protein M3276_06425 [Actinomycetota bacterium]|nr:hypothetical protein [Actinomycetota bacterium]
MSIDYSVHAEARAPEGAEPISDPLDAMERLMGLIGEHDGVCGADQRSWSVTLSLDDADDAGDACERGAALIGELVAKAGLPAWPLAKVEAVRGDVLDEDLARSNIPPLVSAPEAGQILGVSKQRVHQLAATHPGFPKPLYELAAGKLWHRAAVERFAEASERRPGRPPKAS